MDWLTVIFQNSLKMVQERGYPDVGQYIKEVEKIKQKKTGIKPGMVNVGDFDFSKFLKKDIGDYENKFLLSYRVVDEMEKKHNYVIFITGNKVGSDIVMEIIEDTQKRDRDYIKYYDVIVDKDFKTIYKQRIEELERVYELRIHEEKMFRCSPFHSLGSDYQVMSQSEAEKVISDFHITKKDLKSISRNEHIVKYFGFSKGSLLRIFRKPVIPGSLIQETMDYRLVV